MIEESLKWKNISSTRIYNEFRRTASPDEFLKAICRAKALAKKEIAFSGAAQTRHLHRSVRGAGKFSKSLRRQRDWPSTQWGKFQNHKITRSPVLCERNNGQMPRHLMRFHVESSNNPPLSAACRFWSKNQNKMRQKCSQATFNCNYPERISLDVQQFRFFLSTHT